MRFRFTRRTLLRAAWPALAALLPLAAAAQAPADFPTRPLRLVVPFGPGTSTDTVARVVAEAMGRRLGQTVVVENRAGSGGVIGTEAVARAPADGYTLVMGTVGTHAINPALYRKLPYDAARDFTPLGFVGQTPTLLVVAAGSPFQSLQDLRTAAARAPGISFASAGNGTSGHLAGDLLRRALGGQMVHVPYKDGAVGLSDVMAGQVQFMFYHPAAVLPQIKAGKLRALGVSSAKPSQAAPEVPTLQAQTGQPFDLVAWFMVYAPSATPAPVLTRLREATQAALAAPETQARLTAQGLESVGAAGEALSTFGTRETAKWGELVRQSGAQVD